MLITVKQFVSYAGHSIRANGSVNLTFKAMYGELTKTIELLQLLNNDITLVANLAGQPFSLGMFRLKDVKISDDGESTIKFNGLSDYVDLTNLNQLALRDTDALEFEVMVRADVEIDEDADA